MKNRHQLQTFDFLTPSFIMDAVESCGFHCDCRTIPLNSYENRVYQVGIENGAPLIAKFYRPERWSDEQILEEHLFCAELAEHELPVITPLFNHNGESLFNFKGYRFSLYPRQAGSAPEFDNLNNLQILGRTLGRIHAIGAIRRFVHRPSLDCIVFGHDSVALIKDKFMISEYKANYDALTRDLLQALDEKMGASKGINFIRSHGDCHAGNILWQDNSPYFVDFDDARNAPAIQDIWMMLSGNPLRQTAQLAKIIEGYSEFHVFQHSELNLIETLRTLRILHYSAWLARRWGDPAFRHSFPWFNTNRYWSDHILQLREQMAALEEPCLSIS